MKEKKRSVAVVLLLLFALCVSLISPTMASTPKLNTTKKTVVKGQSVKLKVKNTSKAVKWSTSNKKVATVRKTGKTGAIVKTKKAGKVTITAKVGSKKLKCKITVNAMGLNKSSVSLKTGSSTILKVINGKKVSWTSSNSKVVKITSKTSKTAKIKGLKSGKATITAKIGKKKFVCKVTVKKNGSSDDACRLDLSGAGLWLYSDKSKTVDLQGFTKDEDNPCSFPYSATAYVFCDADRNGLTSCSSSDPSVITVEKLSEKKVQITYKKEGTAVIYVVHEGKTFKWTIKVIDSDAKYKVKRSQIYQQIGITNDMKPQYKCFLIAKWMCENIIYKEGSTRGQKYQEAFDEGTAVCAGYSRMFKYFMDGLGIPCEFVTSNIHAWNQVQIDGKWYNTDVTYMDRSVGDEEVTYSMDSFLVSDAILDRSAYNPHKTDTRFDICVYKFECKYSAGCFGHTGNYPNCTLSLEEHKDVPSLTWNKVMISCPWANGEWINY